jgi:DNA replication factor GINS
MSTTAGQQNNNEMDAENSGSLALKDVYKMLEKEIETPTLQSIEPDTFQKIAEVLSNLKGQAYEGVEAKVRDNMVEMLATSSSLIIETRQAKISSGNESLDYSKLTDEEKYILDGKRELNKRMDEIMTALVKGRPKVLESISARMRSKQIVVRFLKPIEAFVGIDMNKYGPYEQEDVASLPFENARSIIDGGGAIEVCVELSEK